MVRHAIYSETPGRVVTFCKKKIRKKLVSLCIPAYYTIYCAEELVDGKPPRNPAWCKECHVQMVAHVERYNDHLLSLVGREGVKFE